MLAQSLKGANLCDYRLASLSGARASGMRHSLSFTLSFADISGTLFARAFATRIRYGCALFYRCDFLDTLRARCRSRQRLSRFFADDRWLHIARTVFMIAARASRHAHDGALRFQHLLGRDLLIRRFD